MVSCYAAAFPLLPDQISFRKANLREVKKYEQTTIDRYDGEVRELISEDFKHMRPASEVLPKDLFAVLPKPGRPH